MRNRINRSILLLFALAGLLICLNPSASFAATIVKSGDCGWNMTWTLDSDGVMTISGEGEMWDCSDTTSLLAIYDRKKVTEVVIKNGVESIGKNAFYGSTNLKKITITLRNRQTLSPRALFLTTERTSRAERTR